MKRWIGLSLGTTAVVLLPLLMGLIQFSFQNNFQPAIPLNKTQWSHLSTPPLNCPTWSCVVQKARNLGSQPGPIPKVLSESAHSNDEWYFTKLPLAKLTTLSEDQTVLVLGSILGRFEVFINGKKTIDGESSFYFLNFVTIQLQKAKTELEILVKITDTKGFVHPTVFNLLGPEGVSNYANSENERYRHTILFRTIPLSLTFTYLLIGLFSGILFILSGEGRFFYFFLFLLFSSFTEGAQFFVGYFGSSNASQLYKATTIGMVGLGCSVFSFLVSFLNAKLVPKVSLGSLVLFLIVFAQLDLSSSFLFHLNSFIFSVFVPAMMVLVVITAILKRKRSTETDFLYALFGAIAVGGLHLFESSAFASFSVASVLFKLAYVFVIVIFLTRMVYEGHLNKIASLKFEGLSVRTKALEHDIRTPLAALNALMRNLSDQPQKAAIYKEATSRIKDMVDSLQNEEEGAKSYSIGTLEEDIRSALNKIEIPKSVNIKFNFHSEEHNLSVLYHRKMFERILINLINNSIEAMSGEGEIEISLESGDQIELTIRDSGPGFNQNILQRLGTDRIRSRKSGGLGVGIFNAVQFIGQWNGSVVLKNHNLGGAEVTIKLQCEES